MAAAPRAAVSASAMSTATAAAVPATADMRSARRSRGMTKSAATVAQSARRMHRSDRLRPRRIAEIGPRVMPGAAVHMREMLEAIRVRELLNGRPILHIAIVHMAGTVLRSTHRGRRGSIADRGVMPAKNVLPVTNAAIAEFPPIPELVNLRVETAVPIMAPPISPNIEPDNRKTDLRSLIDHDDAFAAIERSEIIALRPAVLAAPYDVAPIVTRDAALDTQA